LTPDGTLLNGNRIHGFLTNHLLCWAYPSMCAEAAQPAPSDTVYSKKVYTKNFEQLLNGSPFQRMLQDNASRNMPAIEIELLFCCHTCAG
jgi:hypothetical protein